MSDAWIGKTLSKVTIQRKLGRGGMAEIYLGRHTTLDRPVAVKILHGYLADDESLRVRTQQEARAIASLRHPNIVQVFDFDLAEGRPYIVMELLEGLSLADYLKAHHEAGFSLPISHILHLLSQIASALDYAHQNQIIHRDIKPSNVMLRQGETPLQLGLPLPDDAQVVLTDFGIARITGATRHTSDGSILGTPHYMSPEQINGLEVDARTDIYAMGVMAYEMFAGKLPFGGEEDTPTTILYRQVHEAPEPIPNTAPTIQAVILKCLAKEKSDRFETAGAFALALETAVTDSGKPGAPTVASMPTERQRPKPAWLVPVLLGVGGVTLVAILFFSLQGLFRTPVDSGIEHPVSAAASTSTTSQNGPSLAVLTDIPSQEPQFLLHGSMRIQGSELVLTFVEPLPQLDQPLSIRTRHIDGATIELGEVAAPVPGTELFLTTPDGSSLLGTAEAIVIVTLQDSDLSGMIMGEGLIPPQVQKHFNILEAISTAGDQEDRILSGVNAQVSHYESHLGFALQALVDSNLEGARSHAEHTINILSGAEGEFYGDWNGNQLVENPGDEVGLVVYLELLDDLLSNPLASPDESQRRTAEDLQTSLGQIRSDADLALSLTRQVALADSLEVILELGLNQQLQTLNLPDQLTAILEGMDELELGYYLEF